MEPMTKLSAALAAIELKPAALPIAGDGTPKRLPQRIQGIETAEGGLEIGEPGAIPGVEPRVIRKSSKQTAPVNPLNRVVIKAPAKLDMKNLTQQQLNILRSRSKRVI